MSATPDKRRDGVDHSVAEVHSLHMYIRGMGLGCFCISPGLDDRTKFRVPCFRLCPSGDRDFRRTDGGNVILAEVSAWPRSVVSWSIPANLNLTRTERRGRFAALASSSRCASHRSVSRPGCSRTSACRDQARTGKLERANRHSAPLGNAAQRGANSQFRCLLVSRQRPTRQ